jgi:hypothetical protein
MKGWPSYGGLGGVDRLPMVAVHPFFRPGGFSQSAPPREDRRLTVELALTGLRVHPEQADWVTEMCGLRHPYG